MVLDNLVVSCEDVDDLLVIGELIDIEDDIDFNLVVFFMDEFVVFNCFGNYLIVCLWVVMDFDGNSIVGI